MGGPQGPQGPRGRWAPGTPPGAHGGPQGPQGPRGRWGPGEIDPGAPGPLKSCSASKNTLGDLSTASDRKIFIDFLDVGQYFAYKRYFNTIIRPWDLSRIVDNGLLYILTEYNIFWTGLARPGPV